MYINNKLVYDTQIILFRWGYTPPNTTGGHHPAPSPYLFYLIPTITIWVGLRHYEHYLEYLGISWKVWRIQKHMP